MAEAFDRDKWIEEDCVYTNNETCAACPYVVGDKDGYFKCDKKMHAECVGEDTEN